MGEEVNTYCGFKELNEHDAIVLEKQVERFQLSYIITALKGLKKGQLTRVLSVSEQEYLNKRYRCREENKKSLTVHEMLRLADTYGFPVMPKVPKCIFPIYGYVTEEDNEELKNFNESMVELEKIDSYYQVW